MFQTWGRLRSLANGHRNGGVQMIGSPGPWPGSRHGVPPRNFTPSHRTRMMTMTMRNATGRRHRSRGMRGWTASISSANSRSAVWTSCWAGPAVTSAPRGRASRGWRLARHRLVGDVERAVDDLEALGQLRLGDAQRRVGVDRVVGEHRVHAVVAQELPDRLHLVRGAVERGERRERVARAHEIEDPEQPQAAM